MAERGKSMGWAWLVAVSDALRLTCAITVLCGVGLGIGVVGSTVRAADEKPWEIAPYRVQVTLAVDTARRPQPELETAIALTIRQRVDAALRPLWSLELVVAADPATRRECREPREIPWDKLTLEQRKQDKLLWLNVEAAPAGYALTCREFDAYTRRWGPTLRRDESQSAYLSEACFRLLTEAFTPLARIEPPDDDGQTQLVMKGGGLPRPEGPPLLVAPGDVYLPLLRRTGRSGELAEGGITIIPWTYLIAGEADKTGWTAKVETALGHPLNGRRRGSIEQLAVALRNPSAPARVRFFARSNSKQGLAGYEVFSIAAKGATPVLVGVTDHDGMLVVPPGEKPVTALILRSDGQVLAKLLVAAGTADVIEAPIADDAVRLTAQGEVQAVREELIDVVARRAILIARVQSLLKKGSVEEARTLMDELNSLPTPSTFASRIDAVLGKLPKSEDPRVRQTVEGLFTSTRELLTRFLDAKTITNLQAEVNAARGGS